MHETAKDMHEDDEMWRLGLLRDWLLGQRRAEEMPLEYVKAHPEFVPPYGLRTYRIMSASTGGRVWAIQSPYIDVGTAGPMCVQGGVVRVFRDDAVAATAAYEQAKTSWNNRVKEAYG